MTQIYALPNETHMANGITGVFDYANTVSEGLFIPSILFALWMITFIGSLVSLRINASVAWIFASFLSAIIAVPFAVLGLLNPSYMYLLGVLLAIGVFWRFME